MDEETFIYIKRDFADCLSKFTHMKDTFIATESHNMHTNKQIAMMLPYLVAP